MRGIGRSNLVLYDLTRKTKLLRFSSERSALHRIKDVVTFASSILKNQTTSAQALHGLAPKCKLINMHELINKSTNDYVTLLPCENGVNVNNKG